MQDRFKFRFWHKPTKKMLDVYGFNDDFVCTKTLDGVGTEYNPSKQEDCILMQCLALKDKNGELIYEGDIVKDVITEECFSIVYNNQIGCFGYEPDNADNDFYCTCEKLECNLIIIGNIYENPELLEEEKLKTKIREAEWK